MKREPFAICVGVALLSYMLGAAERELWQLPMWLAVITAAGFADELWQDRLDARNRRRK